MSSHHFVKEGQEPALLLLEPLSLSLVQPLLEWAPLVIVADQAVDEVMHWGIKIDVVMASDSSIEALREKLLSQAPVKVFSCQKNDGIETALHFLFSTKQQAVTIVTHDPFSLFQRLDNFIDKISISLLTEKTKWSVITSRHYKKWLTGGSILFLYGHEKLKVKNLNNRGDHFEVISDGFVEIKAEKPFWTGEIH
jgi:hypothetical protein